MVNYFKLNSGVTPLLSGSSALVTAVKVNTVATGTFNAVRAGPMCVKYEYTGRLDNSSGSVTSGIGYTLVTDPVATPPSPNGLLPDVNYTILTAVEDLPYSRSVPITDSLKAIFIPQDYTLMTLKSPLDSTTTVVPQRLFFLITGGPSGQKGFAKITLVQNWEAIPSISTADWVTASYNPYPADFDPRAIFDYIMSNNLIITKEDSEYGLSKFIELSNHDGKSRIIRGLIS